MSLDISLTVFHPERVFDTNITHNLNKMADAFGLYEVMWRPEEIGVKTAAGALPILEEGLKVLLSHPEKAEPFVPKNGWGSYGGLVKVVTEYIAACKANPEAMVSVSR